jgi:hypothetical protein
MEDITADLRQGFPLHTSYAKPDAEFPYAPKITVHHTVKAPKHVLIERTQRYAKRIVTPLLPSTERKIPQFGMHPIQSGKFLHQGKEDRGNILTFHLFE